MGESKKRGSKDNRIKDSRNQLLGDDPFKTVYDVLFGMIEAVYIQTGGITHQLIGFDFKDGKIAGVNSLPIEDEAMRARIPMNVESMLLKWPVVALVVEAWSAPPGEVESHENTERIDIVSVLIHMQDRIMSAACLVDEAARTVKKGELEEVDKLGGRLGRDVQTAH